MDPTSLPELPKPSRTPGEKPKTLGLEPKILENDSGKSLLALYIPLLSRFHLRNFFHQPQFHPCLWGPPGSKDAQREDAGALLRLTVDDNSQLVIRSSGGIQAPATG